MLSLAKAFRRIEAKSRYDGKSSISSGNLNKPKAEPLLSAVCGGLELM
jgi:hypothetical protein